MLTAIYIHQQWAFFVLIEAKRVKKGRKRAKNSKNRKKLGYVSHFGPYLRVQNEFLWYDGCNTSLEYLQIRLSLKNEKNRRSE